MLMPMSRDPLPIDAATDGMLHLSGPPPLPSLLTPLQAWHERRHLEIMALRGFDDVRRAHNAVFINLPAEGARLTELSDEADMSKQAMGELVDDLEDKGYVERVRDPTDGRAKLIVWAARGRRAHVATLDAFGEIETELALLADKGTIDTLRETLIAIHAALRANDGSVKLD